MGKISNYAQDTTVKLADKLIGSDEGGTTANFTLTSVSNLFKESNAAGVGGQFTWKFDSGAGSNLTAGEMDIASTAGSLNFSALTTLIFSEFTNENPSTNLENAIGLLASRSILIVDVLNHNNYGVFSTGTLSAYAGTTTLHSIPLTHSTSNGALVDGKVYAVTINYPDGDSTYSISCVDGDNSDEEKIRLTAAGSGSGTDDVVLEAGTGLTIARSSDKITFTNTQDITNAKLLTRLAALESASGVGDENITIGTDSGDTIIITGNLQVSGTTTTVNSTTVSLNDHNIVLDSGNSTSAVINNAGITLEGGSGDDVTWMWSTTGPKMELKLGSNYADAQFKDIAANDLDIEGDVDVNGTLEADTITVNGSSLASVIAGTTVSAATLAAGTTVTDSNTATAFPIVFHDESNALLDDTGGFTYKPSEGDMEVPGSVKITKNLRRTVTTATNHLNTHTCTLVDNDNFNITVANAATTIALTVATENIGQSGMITITNPASVGSLSFVALPSYMLTPDGATINFVTAANAVSIISYYVHATDKVLVNYVGKFE